MKEIQPDTAEIAPMRDFKHSLPMELLKAREAAMARFRRHTDLASLRAAIGADRLGRLAGEAADIEADVALEDIEFLPTIPNPEKIICIGVNYANRNEEYKDGSEAHRSSREVPEFQASGPRELRCADRVRCG